MQYCDIIIWENTHKNSFIKRQWNPPKQISKHVLSVIFYFCILMGPRLSNHSMLHIYKYINHLYAPC